MDHKEYVTDTKLVELNVNKCLKTQYQTHVIILIYKSYKFFIKIVSNPFFSNFLRIKSF